MDNFVNFYFYICVCSAYSYKTFPKYPNNGIVLEYIKVIQTTYLGSWVGDGLDDKKYGL